MAEIFIGLVHYFERRQKFGVEILRCESEDRAAISGQNNHKVAATHRADGSCYALLPMVVRHDRQRPSSKHVITVLQIARSGARSGKRIETLIDDVIHHKPECPACR